MDLVLFAFENGKSGDTFVQKAPAASVSLLAHTLKNLLGKSESEIKIIGTRHGEKLYETLLTKEEMVKAIDMDDYYRIPADTRDLNYSMFVDDGEEIITQAHGIILIHQLSEEELKELLLNVHEIQDKLNQFGVK